MKKYIKMLPLILYPYAYLLLFASNMIDLPERLMFLEEIFSFVLPILVISYHLFLFVFVVYNAVASIKREKDAYELAKMNLFIKGLQIPAYILNLLLGLAGVGFLVVGGIGLIIMMIIVDLISVTLTGINSIGCSIRLKKEGILSNGAFVLMAVGCFVYCVDVVIAIMYVWKAKKRRQVV